MSSSCGFGHNWYEGNPLYKSNCCTTYNTKIGIGLYKMNGEFYIIAHEGYMRMDDKEREYRKENIIRKIKMFLLFFLNHKIMGIKNIKVSLDKAAKIKAG